MNEIVKMFGDHPVRMVEEKGEIRFVGKDVCRRLGYRNANDAMKRHCRGVAKSYPLATGGGVQRLRVLTEPDVMRLICGSKLPEALTFEKWVFEEVLPGIRRTGRYAPGEPGNTAVPEREMRRRMEAESKVAFLERQIGKLTGMLLPKNGFGAISKRTGLPMDKVVLAYVRSDRREHKPEHAKYLRLLLPVHAMSELLDGGDGMAASETNKPTYQENNQ